ncbi:MAG TPA: class I SAM-dependent methyltransferase [Armatimonadota bacterium]|jgi:SAM-dependent methyltransferase
MGIRERILLSISRAPEGDGLRQADSAISIDHALDDLKWAFPNLGALVSGKRVVDFGCGVGLQSIALVREFGCSVVGVDSNGATLEKAKGNAKVHNVSSDDLSFVPSLSPDLLGSIDVVISQNSFEHFADPASVLEEMGRLLNDLGIVLISFGPPWLAPYGSHMRFFCKVPWINVLFPEEVVMKVRNRYRNDGAVRYEDVESGLNKMTVAKFEALVSSCNLKITHRDYECVKGINALAKAPLLREFFISNVAAVLSKSG